MAQRAFQLGHLCPDALEVVTGEGEKSHLCSRHDGGCPLPGQEKCNLAEGVPSTESKARFPLDQHIGLSLLDEVDGSSVVVDGHNFGASSSVDLRHRPRQRIDLPLRKIRQDRKTSESSRIHDRGSFHKPWFTA